MSKLQAAGASSAAPGFLCRQDAGYLFSGVRPSSGATGPNGPGVSGKSDTLELAELAAPEDGRTPLNTYDAGSTLRFIVAAAGTVGMSRCPREDSSSRFTLLVLVWLRSNAAPNRRAG